mgnify:CR=1 FL=1
MGIECVVPLVSEEILNLLVKLPKLRVASRTSSFAFKGKNEDLRTIGQTLGVKHILEGSVRKSGDKVRITAQLIDGKTDKHVWADSYESAALAGDALGVANALAAGEDFSLVGHNVGGQAALHAAEAAVDVVDGNIALAKGAISDRTKE